MDLYTLASENNMFEKKDRSRFDYWFAHWCAFQMTALNHHMWRFKYLFHDVEKPWMRLIMPYKNVQKWHRNHNRHHLEWLDNQLSKIEKKYCEYNAVTRFDWAVMMIDWECSRFTKVACPRNARQEVEWIFNDEELLKEKYPNIYHNRDLVYGCCLSTLHVYGFE